MQKHHDPYGGDGTFGVGELSKMQELMSNPETGELMTKAKKTLKLMSAIYDPNSEYRNHPEVIEHAKALGPYF